MSERYDCTGEDRESGLDAAVSAIHRGDLIVLPTDTVYGIGADAFEPDAVNRLLDAKGRDRTMPPPVLVGSTGALDGVAAEVPEAGRSLIEEFWPGGLTLICREQPSLLWDLGETKGTVAVRMPDEELALDLLARTGPLAVSSANLSGQAAAESAADAEDQLSESVAVYLDGGTTPGNTPSTIVDLTVEPPRMLRAGVLGIDRLREIVPDLRDVDEAEQDQAEQDESGRDETEQSASGQSESAPGQVGPDDVDSDEAGQTDVDQTDADQTDADQTDVGQTDAGQDESGRSSDTSSPAG